MFEKSSALLTGYAWVGFQCAKCEHDFLPWEEGVNKFNLCMCSCSVCCLSHCGVRKLQEQCVFSSFASISTGNILIKRNVEQFCPFFPSIIPKNVPVNVPDEGKGFLEFFWDT